MNPGWLAVTLCLSWAPRASAQGTAPFLGSTFPAGAQPATVEIGDFDGDGIADLVVGHGAVAVDDTFAWLRGLGDGRLAAPVLVPFGREIHALAVADMNADGKLDVVAASYAQNFVAVALGDGAGGFAIGPHAATGFNPRSLAVADFDGDGKLDVVTADVAPSLGWSGISLFLGDGAGLLTRVAQAATGPRPSAVVAADVDGDGWPDAVVANSLGSTISVLRNVGGSFAAPQQIAGFPYPYSLAAADLDADGDIDLVASSAGGASIAWNGGSGVFPAATPLPLPLIVTALRAADVSGDGLVDLVFADSVRCVLAVLPGQTGGTFAEPARYSTGAMPVALALGRLDADARLDVVVANSESRDLSVLLGSEDGLRAPRQFAAADRPMALAVLDVNHDGRADVVAGLEYGGLQVLFGDGTGGLAAGFTVAQSHGGSVLHAGHFDADPWIDLAAGSGTRLSILRGTSAGTLTPHAEYAVPGWLTSISSADFDADGALDLVVTGAPFNGISILRGTGTGSFLAQPGPPMVPGAFTLMAADVDLDGRVDVVAIDGGRLLVLQGSGAATLEPPLVFPFVTGLRALAVADIDLDGDPDVMGAGPMVWIARNDGAGNFNAISWWDGGPDATDIAVGDLDADGWPDLVTTDYGRHTLSVLIADGGGGFRAPSIVAPGRYPLALAVADLDADGRTDIAVADFASVAIAVLMNQEITPPGVRRYGRGTPDCLGDLGLSTNVAPRVGESHFAFTCTNTPARAVGRLLLSDAGDPAGSYPRRNGVLFHVGVAVPARVRSIACASDEHGFAFIRAPIPPDPALVGRVLHAQTFWHSSSCSNSPLGVSSSRALRFVIGP